MITPPHGMRIYLACGVTDMRKGMIGLAMLVQQGLAEDPFGGAVFAFRGRRAGLIKLIWHDGVGLCLLTKRLEQGQFVSYGLCQRFCACIADRPSGRRTVDGHDPQG